MQQFSLFRVYNIITKPAGCRQRRRLEKGQFMTKKITAYKIATRILNAFMRALLHSPFHRAASKSVLILSFTGRKSGRAISTPISYLREGDTLLLFTDAPWRKNLHGGALVRLWVQRREMSGWATLVEDDKAAVAAGLARFLSALRHDARFYGVSFDPDGTPNPAQVVAAAQRVSMIQVKLSAGSARQ